MSKNILPLTQEIEDISDTITELNININKIERVSDQRRYFEEVHWLVDRLRGVGTDIYRMNITDE